MQKKHVNILLGLLAIFVIGAAALVAGGAWFAMSVLHQEDADEQTATAAFRDARHHFAGATPVFDVRDGKATLTRTIPTTATGRLNTLHILNWDPEEESLMRADLPFALLRLKDGPIDFVNTAGGIGQAPHRVSFRVSDIERLGPALLMDQQLEDGHRVLIWTD